MNLSCLSLRWKELAAGRCFGKKTMSYATAVTGSNSGSIARSCFVATRIEDRLKTDNIDP
jgi:hypothetical protein